MRPALLPALLALVACAADETSPSWGEDAACARPLSNRTHVFPPGAEGQEVARAFCEEFSGVSARGALEIKGSVTLNCVCTAGTIRVETSQVPARVTFPHLQDVGAFLVVEDAPVHIDAPTLQLAGTVRLEDRTVDAACTRPILDAPRLGRVDMLDIRDDACGLSVYPALQHVRLLRLSDTEGGQMPPVDGDRPTFEDLHLFGVDLNDAVPCVAHVGELHLGAESDGDVVVPPCLRTVEELRISARGRRLVSEEGIEVLDALVALNTRFEDPPEGIRFGTGFSVWEAFGDVEHVPVPASPTPELSTLRLTKGTLPSGAFDDVEQLDELFLYDVGFEAPALRGLRQVRSVRFLGDQGVHPAPERLGQVGQLDLGQTSLQDVDHLAALRSVSRLTIQHNPRLRSLRGLHGLERVDELVIRSNTALPAAEVDALIEAIDELGAVTRGSNGT